MKFSTGKGSRVKHATAAEPDKIQKARRDHPRPCYSTGESASILHFTGKQTDYRALADGGDPDLESAREPDRSARQAGWGIIARPPRA